MNNSDELVPLPEPVEQDVLRQFAENQAQEFHLRQQEQSVRRQEVENAHEYALKLLDAQLVDRQRERESSKNHLTTGGWFVMVIVLALIGGICYALYLNKDQLVIELVKAIIFIVSGGIGGYSLKTLNAKKDDPDAKEK